MKLRLVLYCTICAIVFSQPPGWRMVDRFYGFRYELQGAKLSNSIATQIQAKADELGCFGWVQPKGGMFVGEVRCNKAKGPVMQQWLQESSGADIANFKVYEDTKIRLHFSHFKILEEGRDTCFLDPPHQCESDKSHEQSSFGSEL